MKKFLKHRFDCWIGSQQPSGSFFLRRIELEIFHNSFWRLSHTVSRRWCSGSSTTGFNWTQPSPRPWSSAQGRVFPGWSPSPRWISAMVTWRSGTKSKSSVFIWIQPCLSMNAQVKALLKTSNFHIRALWHVRQGLTFESAKMIALGLVTSRLDYCNSLLYTTSKANIGRLERVQNNLVRVVLQAAWNSSSKPLLKHLHWLPVQQRITFKIDLVTFNMRTFEQPSYLHSLLDNYTPSRILRSEGQHLLRIPFWKSAAARCSFCFAAPTVWNSLNSSTREATGIGTFKTKLFLSAFQWTSTALLPCIRIVLGQLFFVLCRNIASKTNSIMIIINFKNFTV